MAEIKIDGVTMGYEIETGRSKANEPLPYVAVTWAEDVRGYVEIPAEIEGLPVKRIGGLAFSAGCGELTGVTIPDSVVWICESAFAHNAMLTCVRIPPSVKVIDECAFAGCGGLRWVDIPEGVVWIGFSAFIMCQRLVRVTIPSTLERIPRLAFSDCCSLSHVTISHGVKDIAEEAFSDCIRLENVTMPDSVESIGRSAFSGCSRLANVSLPRRLENTPIESAFVTCSPKLSISYRDVGKACVAGNGVSDLADDIVF